MNTEHTCILIQTNVTFYGYLIYWICPHKFVSQLIFIAQREKKRFISFEIIRLLNTNISIIHIAFVCIKSNLRFSCFVSLF